MAKEESQEQEKKPLVAIDGTTQISAGAVTVTGNNAAWACVGNMGKCRRVLIWSAYWWKLPTICPNCGGKYKGDSKGANETPTQIQVLAE